MTELTRRQGYTEFYSSDHLIKENELLRETIKDRDITIQKMTDSAEIQKLRMVEIENELAKVKELNDILTKKPKYVYVEKEQNVFNPPFGR